MDGWYNHAVSVDFSGSDQTAGVDACTSATYAGPDSGAASLAGTCRDRAGNVSSPLGYGLKYDATAPRSPAPTRSARRTPPAGSTGRSTSRSSAPTRPRVSRPVPPTTYGGPDSATASFTGSCRDRAGNSANRTFALKYDSTAPTVTAAQAARGPDVNGWYNRPVVGRLQRRPTSCRASTRCTTLSYAGPDSATASLAGTCTDEAGNVSAPLGFGLKYDATAPIVTGGTPGAGGRRERLVQPRRLDRVRRLGPDLGRRRLHERHLRRPGQRRRPRSPAPAPTRPATSSGPLGFGLKYDATAPQVTTATPAARPRRERLVQPPRRVRLRRHGRDLGHRRLSPGHLQRARTARRRRSPGSARDRAGNAPAAPSGSSTTPPHRRSPARAGPAARTWTAGTTTRSRSPSAAPTRLSGVDTCTTTTYGGPDGAAASVPGTCTDKAGNVERRRTRFALKYDATAPTVTSAEPPAGRRERLVQPRGRRSPSTAPTRHRASTPARPPPTAGRTAPRPRSRARAPTRPATSSGQLAVRPQVRRDRTGRDRCEARAAARTSRLVRPPGAVRRHAAPTRPRASTAAPPSPTPAPTARARCVGVVPRPRGQRHEPGLPAQLRRHARRY